MIYAYLAYPYRKDTIIVPARGCSCITCKTNGEEVTTYYCMCVYCMEERARGSVKRPPPPIPLTLITPCQYPLAILTCRTFYTEITSYLDTAKRPVDKAYTTPRAIIDITGVIDDDDTEGLLEYMLRCLGDAREFTWGLDGDVYDSEDNGTWGCLANDEPGMAHVHRFIKASGRHLFDHAPGAWFASENYDYVREMRGELIPQSHEEREDLEQQILAASREPHDNLNLLFLGKELYPAEYIDNMMREWKMHPYKEFIDVPVNLYRENDEPVNKAIGGPRGEDDEEWDEERYNDEIELQDMGQISKADWLEYWA
jgi:hypothetical protein